jgi:AraC-like DNA-binding protein
MLLSAGVERQQDPQRYRWDGMRRGHDVKCPQGVAHAIVQYTLSGSGRYADADGERPLPTGHAFIALVPSAHRYWLPQDGAPWSFCWFAVAHSQIMDRMRLHADNHGAVFDANPDSALAQRLFEVVEGLLRKTFFDDFAIESALWDFVAELDRHHDRLARPPANKQALLDRVRSLVMADLSDPIGATDIAKRLGWHRVYFAERFRAAAGFPPGAFITSLRLDEARRLLRNEDATLEKVAHAVGLGSASRLCRLFRRHFGATPGAYRG